MIVVLTGPNDFQRGHELKRLVSDFIAEYTDMAVERYDGEDTDTARMRESLQSMPFLTARKMVLLREPAKQKDFAENINQIIEAVADTTDLIIIEPKIDKRLSYYKTLKKIADFRELKDLDANGLAKWAVGYANEQGGSLQGPDARELVERVAGNQQMLKLEIDKLLTYDPQITGITIDLLTARLPQSTVFELLDATFAGKTTHALALYNEQRLLKVEPQAIIAMLAWQLHILVIVKAAAGQSVDAISKAAKLNPFVVRKSQSLVRGVSVQQLKKQVDELLALDYRLKRTSTDADEALQLYILQLTV